MMSDKVIRHEHSSSIIISQDMCLSFVSILSFFLLDLAFAKHLKFPNINNRSSLALNHLVIDSRTGELYVGAVNRIFHLNDRLEVLEEVSTGPRLDNVRCTSGFGERSCSDGGTALYESIRTDNANKVLAIENDSGRLIVCGSVFQGVCETRTLENLTDVLESPGRNGRTDYFVAANSPQGSTVALVAGGHDGRSALFVAAEFTGGPTTTVRQAVPAVSSRVVSGGGGGAFRLAYFDGLTGGTAVHLRREAMDKYPVVYADGFVAGQFAYFVTNQPEYFSLESTGTPPRIAGNYVTRIVQVCRLDRKFYSYAEIPLRCRSEEADYNLAQAVSLIVLRTNGSGASSSSSSASGGKEGVLVAVTFAKSGNKNSALPAESSAVCLYRLSDVRKVFTRNFQRCFSAEQKFVGEQFNSRLCTKLNWNITDSYCGEAEQNGPLVGTIPLEAYPSVVLNNTLVTSVVAMIQDEEEIVLFLGSSDGFIHKVALQPEMTYHVIEKIPVDVGWPVSRDMNFDPTGLFVYAMTTNRIVKIPTSNCQSHPTCHSCHSARDPYCGWCSLERRCSTRASCVNADLEKRWLRYDSKHCADDRASHVVSPKKIGMGKIVQVSVQVKPLPPLQTSEQYVCCFGSSDVCSIGIAATDEILCQISTTAIRNATLKASDRTDHANVTLSVLSTATNVSFVEANVTFYDCSRHSSCTLCTNAVWGCRWCIESNVCSGGDEEDDDVIKCASDPISTAEVCPHLTHPNGSSMVISSDVETQLRISGRHFPSPASTVIPDYRCVVHLAAPPIVLRAKWMSAEEIVCDDFMYSYAPEEPEKVASVEVTWFRDFYVDDFYGVSVTIYKCALLATDCSTCLSLQDTTWRPAKYDCQWCNGRCQHNSTTCGQEQTATCPLPDIHDVFPLSGPLEGGTLLTITGLNLGSSVDQIRNSISVAGVPCEILPKKYLVSRRVVCRTGPTTEPRRAPVVVSIGDNTRTSFGPEFRYQKPEVTSIFPRVGPVDGGTVITFQGRDLDAGNFFRVLLDSIPCMTNGSVHRNSTVFVCATVPVPSTTTVLEVVVVFDEVSQRTGLTFEYTKNPTIHEIFPRASFASGGRIITVTGDSFSSVQSIGFHLSKGNFTANSSCSPVDSSKLLCVSPNIDSEFSEFEVSFTMDGVTSVRNLPLHFPNVESSFAVYRNPLFLPFDDGRRIYRGEALVLGGRNLNLACGSAEVLVFVGTEACKVNSLDSETLYCTPPDRQPEVMDASGRTTGNAPIVKVVIGNYVQILGELEYQSSFNPLNDQWVIGVGVGGGALFTVVVVILVVYKRRSSEAVRQFRKLQLHLNTMEVNIRNECKQAFAELQTEVSDFTSDLDVIGIPFWEYKVYSINVFFPAHPDYSVLRCDMKAQSDRHKRCDDRLQGFKQLLSCSRFLLVFIQTLEEQKNFSIKDRSIVASLLVVILHDKMNYVTEILKCLLNDLIDRCIEKRQAKLMLRRNESVAEKLLTNWLTLSMYDHLHSHSGKALFMLYRAIKHQIEKGPVDVITLEARYALTQERLLREKIEAKVLVINLLVGESLSPLESTACKMLDCDTITQAKEKALNALFLNAPFSFRPSVFDIDLEWESPVSQRIIVLNDEDMTTTTNKGWHRINTLGHYRIPDGATLTIVPRRKHDFNSQAYNVMDNSHSPVSSMTPFFMSEEGSKFYHLVKHDDSQNSVRGQKVISEVFLTRLLATKCTLQQFIDDLFVTMLSASSSLPPAIKYLFDFLDRSAAQHKVIDPEVTHTWKSNSLLLRFWMSLIKNPEFLFDINKSAVVDSCLSVIAQTVVDTCSTQTQTLGKDSPSSKLLFAKDIPRYRQWLSQFYRTIQDLPSISDKEMSEIMLSHSQKHSANFNSGLALKDLYKYAEEYSYELVEALDSDPLARKLQLGNRFVQACKAVDGNNFY